MIQNSFNVFSVGILPVGFVFPERYLELSQGVDWPDGINWWFDDAETDGGKLAWKLRTAYSEWKNIGGRCLIPFAQLNNSAAFFDGDDLSGNPKVIVIDLGNKERVYEEANFDTWLADIIGS